MLPSKWPVFIRSRLAGFDRSLTLEDAKIGHGVGDRPPMLG
jgi:hypothetical protein